MELHLRRIITLAIVALSVFTSAFGDQATFIVSIALICLIGIPHGATDHLLFFSIAKKLPGNHKVLRLRFYLTYLGIMATYGLFWYLSPGLSFLIFILVSFYHFGQENLKEIRWKSSSLKYISFLLSGVFVLATPLLADMKTALPIIEAISGIESISLLDIEHCRNLALASGVVYGTYILVLMLFRHLDLLAGVHELANWLILFALFLNTPLMMGFAVYFSLWHALPSIIEQIGFLKKNQLKYSFHKHVLNIAPYTLLSIGGIFLGLYFLKDSSLAAQTGIGFMFLSIITMPHILLMDRFHELNAENAPSSDFTRTATT